MNTLKEIMGRIESREWDNFEEPAGDYGEGIYFHKNLIYFELENEEGDVVTGERYYSLADLLANKSWCKAVWGSEYLGDTEASAINAFTILLRKGQQAALDYITKSMS